MDHSSPSEVGDHGPWAHALSVLLGFTLSYVLICASLQVCACERGCRQRTEEGTSGDSGVGN